MDFSGTKMKVKFGGSCLKKRKITYKRKSILNLYIVYEINSLLYD